MLYSYPISSYREFHAGCDGAGLHANALWVRVRPEVVLRGVQCIRLESETLPVTHSNRLKQQAAAFEQMTSAAGRPHAVMEAGNDTRVNEGS